MSRISEFTDWVTLCDVYMAYDNTLITVAYAGDWAEPLRSVEWTGCHNGPFHELRFLDVPGCTYPLAPISLLYDLDDVLNRLINKVFRQAEQEKMLHGVLGEAKDDIERINAAYDGQSIRIDAPGGVQDIHSGGASQATVAIIMTILQLFNRAAGNMDIVGGLAAISPTATQDEMLSKSANKLVEAMQKRMMKFARRVMVDVCYNLYHDPVGKRTLRFSLPGHDDITSSIEYGPKDRGRNFFSHRFDIDPYSMQRMTPAAEVAAMTNLLGSIVLPMLPMLQQQGISLDGAALMRRYSRLLNMPSLESFLVNVAGGAGVGEDDGQDHEAKPFRAPTHSVYERRGSPGQSLNSQLGSMAQMAMAAGKNGQQTNQRRAM